MVYILTKKGSPLVLFSGSKVKEQLNFEVSIELKVTAYHTTFRLRDVLSVTRWRNQSVCVAAPELASYLGTFWSFPVKHRNSIRHVIAPQTSLRNAPVRFWNSLSFLGRCGGAVA